MSTWNSLYNSPVKLEKKRAKQNSDPARFLWRPFRPLNKLNKYYCNALNVGGGLDSLTALLNRVGFTNEYLIYQMIFRSVEQCISLEVKEFHF